MKPSQDLFLLIKAMSRGEKRHFRLYAKKYEKTSNYIRLFNAIEKQECPDEEQLSATLARILPAERLTHTKNYLYDFILRSLRDYADYAKESSPETTVALLRQDISALLEKSLYPQAEKLLQKAKNLCRDYELLTDLLQILRLELVIPGVDRARYFEEWQQTLWLMENTTICERFSYQTGLLAEGRGIVRSRKEMEEIDTLLKNFPFAHEDEALTCTAKISFHHGFANYYFIRGDAEAECREYQATIQTFLRYPRQIQAHIRDYITTIVTLCTTQLRLGHYEEMWQTIETLRQTEVPAADLAMKRVSLYLIELTANTSTLRLDAAAEMEEHYSGLIETCQSELHHHDADYEVHFLIELAFIRFLRGEYERSLGRLAELLRHPALAKHQRIENTARLLFLMVHYELGNIELLPYLIRSTYRFFLKRGQLYSFERTFLRYLRRLSTVSTRQELFRWFRVLHDELYCLAQDPVEGKFLRRFDYLAWLQSKITDQSFLDILRSRQQDTGDAAPAA